jgi:hypothetical protein
LNAIVVNRSGNAFTSHMYRSNPTIPLYAALLNHGMNLSVKPLVLRTNSSGKLVLQILNFAMWGVGA